ncbi:MAG: hypothetical protein A2723_00780 [Candidatus Zambryskibacteria bacterium RIFCSPHIGHO2_01_FULL_52_18]|nr:MAG: hypothetical protein A2723_00780 [Candidatus Zambryskibacteria bacterium RIFCSPHIGHO2_01_FULL_52_18]
MTFMVVCVGGCKRTIRTTSHWCESGKMCSEKEHRVVCVHCRRRIRKSMEMQINALRDPAKEKLVAQSRHVPPRKLRIEGEK